MKRILLWSVSIAGFTGALVGAAILGIATGKRTLPEAVRGGGSSGELYPVGILVTVGSETEPVYFSQRIQPIRDFWFANPSPEERGRAESPPADLQVLEGGIEVRTLSQDADVMEVDILTGEAGGRTGWIHLSQLPRQP